MKMKDKKCKYKKSKKCSNDCRYWINYKEEENCSLISIDKNGPMNIREIGKRLGISYVRVHQILKKTLKTMGKRMSE